jgi:hypothetical protein
MFRFFLHSTRTVAIGAVVLVFGASTALAAFTAPGLIKDLNENPSGQADRLAADPNATGENFSPGDNVFAFGGAYGLDQNGAFLNNDMLVVTQSGSSGGTGAGFTISVSNGENGDGVGIGGASGFDYCADGGCLVPGTDPSNTFNAGAPDPVFTTIGNASGRLEDGNVVRFSVWVRNDPFAPTTVEPQITPIVKLEFWRNALSGHADFTGGVTNPNFGSRIFDTDQNDTAITNPNYRKRLVDIDGNGTWTFGSTTEPVPVTTAWQQIVHIYEVDSLGLINGDVPWDIDPFGTDPIASNPAVVEDVTQVEEIRAVMFVGDFLGTALGGPGNLWWDNTLVEVFKDTTAEAASSVLTSNPSPALDELPGDFDSDGDVDGTDFLIWQRGGSAFPLSQSDLADWEANYGTVVPLAGALSSVPEPSAGLLMMMGLLGLNGIRRNRR